VGEVARDREAAGRQVEAGRLELADRPADVRTPAAAGNAPAVRANFEALELAQIGRERFDHGAFGPLRRHRDPAFHGEWEAEAVVVVGVLPDQVDPAGGEGLDTAPFAGAVF
jgi:hypothetical protein